MDILQAVILGLVQGVTEFLPISSTGHLVLVRNWMDISDVNGLAVDAVLHFATTIAVIAYFWQDLLVLTSALFRKLGRLPVNERDITMVYALIIGTIPAVLLGIFLEPVVTTYLETPLFVAGFLFLASLFFLYAEWKYYLKPIDGALTARKGLLIGLFQAMALVPGFSRSGSTIAGGMLLGLSRYESSRFSFLLAIPITLGVGAKKSLDLLRMGGSVDWGPILVGAVVAGITAFVVVHFFLSFMRKYTLWPFIWYGIILSGLVAYVSFLT
ncbi:MAG: undecaprenyl-diphosphate phosphatase [Patescibacteria group bacterium]